MRARQTTGLTFLIASSRLGVTALLASLLFGQGKGKDDHYRIGLPEDWTHRFVVFSNENSPSDSVLQDARFWHQYFKRHADRHRQGGSHGSNASQPDPSNLKGKKPGPGVDWNVSLGGGGVADGMFPAKFTFDVTAAPSCTNDFIVFPINKDPAAGQANLIAFNNLYTNPSGTGSCTGTGPSVKWSYRIGTKAVKTSPVLSLDGAKVAFIDNTNPANFYVLTPGTASEGTSATAPVIPGSAGSNAVLVTVPLTGATKVSTRSSPFVDYSNDAAYVGTDDGKLFRIKNVFGGTPAVDWSLQLKHGATDATQLTGSIFSSRKVFVTDDKGFLYAVNTVDPCGATAAPCEAGSLDVSNAGAASGALLEPPLVDSANQTIFMFAGGDGTSAVVVQANASLAELARINVGKAGGSLLHPGTFDDRYFTLGATSGFLYVCGKQSTANGFATNNDKPTLYRIGFTGATPTLSCLAAGSACTAGTGALEISNNTGEGSSLTELKNGTTDRLFVGVTKGTNGVGLCPFGGGCIESFDITGSMPATTAVTAVSQAGGTSGIVVDNVSANAEASSIYFGPLGANLAVKLTQAGLQ